MKRLIYIFLVVAAVMTISFSIHSRQPGVNAATIASATPSQGPAMQDTLSVEDFEARIEFERPTVNLGELTPDSGKQKFEFKFVNSGNAPLVLTYVHASCSCIGLEYPRAPIAPGDSASIKGFLNPGAINEADFKRNILIRSNANPSQHRVFIVGKIKK